jgi:hypothetical protein
MQDFVKKMILLLADGGVEYAVVGGISAVLQVLQAAYERQQPPSPQP